jgi:membrane-bound lytic murein transglycosylase B
VSRSSVLVALAAVALVVVAGLAATRDLGSRGTDQPAAQVPPAAASPTPDQVRDVARATGIPRRALDAYVAAAETVGRDDARCRIAWNTLAGIGSSESSHGSFGGARLDDGGVARPLIIGVPLDGTGGNRAIRDTDAGRLDDDTRWDRAVGPMQFIPTTWRSWGADGDGDGRVDPHDIDDAALAAARYLCRAGTDLSSSAGWSTAVLTYNNSGEYARKVARTATEYAEAT